ncbi:MAG: MFS transporter [Bifidobacteriaceae bacterium]|jgi:EmrB/QacA subfamily drug resistance transporter|nr:MFS transporter [Bifidobacteriaceae bacterium]
MDKDQTRSDDSRDEAVTTISDHRSNAAGAGLNPGTGEPTEGAADAAPVNRPAGPGADRGAAGTESDSGRSGGEGTPGGRDGAGPAASGGRDGGYPVFSHRQIMRILSGLLLAMFVANVAGTVVANALPVITAALGSTQQEYTWIVTATLLASTASTPIWGKLSDLFNKKNLFLIGLAVFIVGSVLAGFSPSTGYLIGFRAVQGVGLGAMMSLTQSIIGSVIPPLERGRYMAYTGAVIAVATVVGPLIGGFLVDVSWLGWRWCFWSAAPLAAAAGGVLQFQLKMPKSAGRASPKVDWPGAALVTVAVCALLVWISFAGHSFAYGSWQTAALLGGFAVAGGAFVWVESKAANPIIPLWLMGRPTTALAVAASIAVGVGMFGASVFLGQYYQVARGYSPTAAGLMMVPMMLGVLASSVFIGRWVSRAGVWKPFVVAGSVFLVGGFGLMATVRFDTPLVLIAAYGLVTGLGVGMTMQNLVLAVQNSVSVHDVGAASSVVTFFRSLGGAVGIQVLGSVFAADVSRLVRERVARLGASGGGGGAGVGNTDSMSLDLAKLPKPVADAVRSAYGDSVGRLFLIGAAVSVLSLVATLLMRGTRLAAKFDTSESGDTRR